MDPPAVGPVSAIDQEAAIQRLLQRLLIAGPSCDESPIVVAVVDCLERTGLGSDQIEFDSARRHTPQTGQVGNLLGRLPVTRPSPARKRSALFVAVPICAGCEPMLRHGIAPSALGCDQRNVYSAEVWLYLPDRLAACKIAWRMTKLTG